MADKFDGNDLIGTKSLPVGYTRRRVFAREARAYTELAPYPLYGMFKEWKEDERGPLPLCWPLPRDVLSMSSDWLFSKEIKFKLSVEDDPDADVTEPTKFIHDVWEENKMAVEMKWSSFKAGYEGGLALDWAWPDPEDEFVKMLTYSLIAHVRLFYDPHDDERLVMARIQYPYFNPAAKDPKSDKHQGGMWFMHREDWTEDKHVVYNPRTIPTAAVHNAAHIGDPGSWVWSTDLATGAFATLEDFDPEDINLEESGDNTSGVIPLQEIVHIDTGKPYGEGDLWRFYRLVDQYNLTRSLANTDNQISVKPHKVYIDLKPQEGEELQATAPEVAEVLESNDPERQGKVQVLDNAATSRDAIDRHSETLEATVRDATGYPRFNAEDITNKGNLSLQVMRLVFARQIAVTNGKRRRYGEYGIAPFLEDMLRGLKNGGHPTAKKFDDNIKVEVIWPPYFDIVVEELKENVELQNLMIESGYTTTDRAILDIASMMEVDDTVALAEELEVQAKEQEDAAKKAESDERTDTQAGNDSSDGARTND